MEFLLDVLSQSGQVTARKMFGEYCLYYAGRPVGLVCDEQLFLKPGAAVERLLKDTSWGMPYPGARPHLQISPDDWDDRAWMNRLVRVAFESLPPPKPSRQPGEAGGKAAARQAGAAALPRAGIDALPGLGPKSREMLAAAGITGLAQLRRLGAVAAYVRVRKSSPRASLNLLWALEGALSGTPWQVVAREHRTSLLLALEQQQEQRPGTRARNP